MHRTVRTVPGTGSARRRFAVLAAVVLVLMAALGIAGPPPGATGEPVVGAVAGADRHGDTGPRAGGECGVGCADGPGAEDGYDAAIADGLCVGGGCGVVCADRPSAGGGCGAAFADGSRADGTCDDGTCDDGSRADGSRDDGTCDDGSRADGTCADGTCDDGSRADGTCDDGSRADGPRVDGPRAGDGCGTVCAVRAATRPESQSHSEHPAPRGHLATCAPGTDATPPGVARLLLAPAAHPPSSDPHAPHDRGRAPPATSGI
jgi:hypothetical protein